MQTQSVSGGGTEKWEVVGGNKKGKKKPSLTPPAPNLKRKPGQPAAAPKKAQPAATSSAGPNQKAKAKMTPPRSSAVVVTLQPEAIAQGVCYKTALLKAKQVIALPDLGISGVMTRHTATGARIIELPGAKSAEAADRLAAKLSEALAGVATVTRPTKCADLRITGLEESITRQDVIDAVAAKGGCNPDQVKAAEIRFGPNGAGSVNLKCPISAAKVILNGGRLLVGWSSARVRALDALPMRCFKCMGIGHTRMTCPSDKERVDLCFRCGRPGHKSAGCMAEARCVVCAEAGRPAGHTMGGRNCNPPPTKARAAPRAQVAASISGRRSAVPEEVNMQE